MSKRTLVAIGVVAVGLLFVAIPGVSRSSEGGSASALARGTYLVEGVGMCADCHTPHDQKGEPVRAHWLAGAPIPFKPLHPMPWADKASQIAGLPNLTDEAAVTLLRTGLLPSGQHLRPPMPQYRLSEDDARAVVLYLRSLDRGKK